MEVCCQCRELYTVRFHSVYLFDGRKVNSFVGSIRLLGKLEVFALLEFSL